FVFKSGVVGSFACDNSTFGDPAYGWRKGCYARPSGGGVAYEAEAASLGGAAIVAGCSSCAGGKKVGYLGGGANRVAFAHVDAAWSGVHTLVVHGCSADPRTFDVSVNGAAPVAVGLQSGDWSKPTTVAIHVTLNRGDNTIVIGNDAQYAPDLDRIVVW